MDYEKALEKARSAYGTGAYDDATLEFIFPQLKENEDERIRKWIASYIHRGVFNEEEYPMALKAIEYLEKQKEPENTSASTMIPSFHEELTEFELVLFNAVLDNNFVGVKGSENALAMTKKVAPELLAIAKKEPDWDREKCFICQEYEKGFKQGHLEGCTAGYNKAMKEVDEQKEQKPAKWSEEDKTRLTNILIMLQEYVIHHYSKDDVNKSVDWLKSLPERFVLQPKQEWSEENEKIQQDIQYALRYAYFNNVIDKQKLEYTMSWLNSLRPSWKPSEEQMEALNALNLYGDLSYVGQQNQLISLYQDLKKLM